MTIEMGKSLPELEEKQRNAILSIKPPFTVTVIGSGNWGTTIAKIVAENCDENPLLFTNTVRMWVFEEVLENGKNLTEVINETHINKKYLPGIQLPKNLVAIPDLIRAVEGSNILIFNIPHQFLSNVLKTLKGHVRPQARAISCLKGLDVSSKGCTLLTDYITKGLGIHCGQLSGANIAHEVAAQKFSETTIAYPLPKDYFSGDVDNMVIWRLFHRPYFHINVIDDIAGISIAGALKNVIAIAVGFVDGLEWGENAKAAIMRRGLLEMVKFGRTFFPGCTVGSFTEESAGIADLFTTCSGGRNVKIARAMAQTGKSAEQLEKELLNGQSAQGLVTAREVHEFLHTKGAEEDFPLLEATYQMLYNGVNVGLLPYMLENARFQRGMVV